MELPVVDVSVAHGDVREQRVVELRGEILDRLQPDTIVILDSHWFTTVEHVVSAHEHREGKTTSSELPRGMKQVPYNCDGDRELALLIEKFGNQLGTPTHPEDDPYLPVHCATVNLVHYPRGDSATSWP